MHAIDIGKLKEEKKNTDTEAESKVQVSVAKGNQFVCEPVQPSAQLEEKQKQKKTVFELSRVLRVCSQLLAFFSSEKRAFLKKLVLLFLFLKFGPIPNPKLLEHKYTFYPSTQHMIVYVIQFVHVIEGKQLR